MSTTSPSTEFFFELFFQVSRFYRKGLSFKPLHSSERFLVFEINKGRKKRSVWRGKDAKFEFYRSNYPKLQIIAPVTQSFHFDNFTWVGYVNGQRVVWHGRRSEIRIQLTKLLLGPRWCRFLWFFHFGHFAWVGCAHGQRVIWRGRGCEIWILKVKLPQVSNNTHITHFFILTSLRGLGLLIVNGWFDVVEDAKLKLYGSNYG